MIEPGIIDISTKWNFEPTAETKAIFNNSLGSFLSLKYTLIASKSDYLNGTRYVFLCEAEPTSSFGEEQIIQANVYVPLKGKTIIQQIIRAQIV